MQRATTEAERERAYLASLRPFYHPVATRAALAEVGVNEHGQRRVLGAEVLGERIVLAELDGRVVALRGTCPHRGAGLHLGWLNADCSALVCRYHGFEWGAGGELHRLPAFEVEGRPLPSGPGWRVETYPTVEKYGLIWVCLEPEPRLPVLAAAPEGDPEYVTLPTVEQEWAAGCGRIVEAFMDTYHFPFTHWGSLGDPSQPAAPKAEVALHADYFYSQYTTVQPNTRAVNYDSAAAGDAAEAFLTSTYRMWAAPNAIYFLKMTGDIRFGVLAAVCPVGPKRARLFRVMYASRHWDADHAQLMRTQDAINAEDRLVVESAHPWELTTDLDAELQTAMDRPTVNYRRWLAGLGVQFM
jgi:phenylpropionate dioxygenase-like ring-hydroxylating dioxygenase large terminal subunit